MRTVLADRDVRLLLGAGLVSQTGDWILRTGIGYQIYVLTGSTVAAATVLLVSLAPQVLLGSFAGAVVDRTDRRRTMIVVNLLLAAVLIPLIFVHQRDQVWIVYLVLAVSSCLSPFFLAAEATMLPAMITDPRTRVTANALNSQVRDASRLIGAALGGLIAGAGTPALAVADLASFALASALLILIRHRPERLDVAKTRLVRDLAEGFAVVRHSRSLLVILFFMAVTGVGEAIMGTLAAPFVHDVLGGRASDFGMIMSAQAIGGIAGGLLVTVTGHRFRPRTLFGCGAALFGLLDLALFLYPLGFPAGSVAIWPAVVLIVLVGLPGAALNAGMITVLQTATSDRVRGRVFGTVTAAQNLTMLATTLLAGVAAARAGIVPILVVQGAAYVLAGVVVMIALRGRIDTCTGSPTRSAESSATPSPSEHSPIPCG